MWWLTWLGAISAVCQASAYTGATGRDKIEAALNDTHCRVIELATTGPDAAGVWAVNTQIRIPRSEVTIQGPIGAPPTLLASGSFSGAGMFVSKNSESHNEIVIRNLIMDGGNVALNGVWWNAGGTGFTVTQTTIKNMVLHGVHINTLPMSDVTVSGNTITDTGLIGVRTDTAVNTAYHARVSVTKNTISGSDYGVALANCGTSTLTACAVTDNAISSVDLSGIDFNLVHYATMARNVLTALALRCITLDDATHDTITLNTCTGPPELGIVLANGALVANKPWHITDNTVSNNTVTGGGSTAVYLGASSDLVNDVNDNNAITNNTLSGNSVGCGKGANVMHATFSGNGPDSCSP